MSILRSCIRTISRQFSSRTTEELPVPRERNIWILGIFLSPTKSKRGTFILSIVPPTIWSRIFYQTSSRQEMSSVQKIYYESTGMKYTLTKGVCWGSTSFILSKYCPIFGFQSHLLPVLFRMHEWIICCSILIILPSLFAELLKYEVKNDWRRLNSWHLFTIAIDISNFLLAKPW